MTLWIVFKTLITRSCPQKMSSLVYQPKKALQMRSTSMLKNSGILLDEVNGGVP